MTSAADIPREPKPRMTLRERLSRAFAEDSMVEMIVGMTLMSLLVVFYIALSSIAFHAAGSLGLIAALVGPPVMLAWGYVAYVMYKAEPKDTRPD